MLTYIVVDVLVGCVAPPLAALAVALLAGVLVLQRGISMNECKLYGLC